MSLQESAESVLQSLRERAEEALLFSKEQRVAQHRNDVAHR